MKTLANRARPAAAALLLLASSEALGATIHAPGPYSSIQEAVNEAVAGDTVLVAPGRYTEVIELKNGITFRGADGPDSTVLVNPALTEKLADQRLLVIPEGCDRSTVVEGLHFDGGGSHGVAIMVDHAQPTIRGNTIVGFGWGILLQNSDARIEDNHIHSGSAYGIQVRGSSPEIFRNTIRDQTGHGIGISGKLSRPLIGGSRENANRIYGNQEAIENTCRNDIDATWNDWGWNTASEMEAKGYPADIQAIADGADLERRPRGRGIVDYRNWLFEDPDAPAEAADEAARFPRAPLFLAVGLVVVLVVFSRLRRARAG